MLTWRSLIRFLHRTVLFGPIYLGGIVGLAVSVWVMALLAGFGWPVLTLQFFLAGGFGSIGGAGGGVAARTRRPELARYRPWVGTLGGAVGGGGFALHACDALVFLAAVIGGAVGGLGDGLIFGSGKLEEDHQA